MSNRTPHILLTGAHRSGTTFVGRLLSLPRTVGYLNEPFNPDHGITGISRAYTYVRKGSGNEAQMRTVIERLLAGKASYRIPTTAHAPTGARGMPRRMLRSRAHVHYRTTHLNPVVRRLLLKDPLAALSSAWLHEEFGMSVIALVRHPAAFTSSLKRMEWHPVRALADMHAQDELMADHLAPLLEGVDFSDLDIVEASALCWACTYTVLGTYLDHHPRMLGMRHEDISTDPHASFAHMYSHLGFTYGDRARAEVEKATRSGNPVAPVDNATFSLQRDSRANAKRWKTLLSAEEVSVVRDIAGPVARRWYSDDDW